MAPSGRPPPDSRFLSVWNRAGGSHIAFTYRADMRSRVSWADKTVGRFSA
jgi:hypothetical protein